VRPWKETATTLVLANLRTSSVLRSCTMIICGVSLTKRALIISFFVSRPKKRPAVFVIALITRFVFVVFIDFNYARDSRSLE